MKKIIAILLFLVSLIAAQGAPVVTSSGVWEVVPFRVIKVGTFDSLAGATDSSVLLNKFTFPSGWNYMIQFGTSTGSDSVKVGLRADLYDDAGVFIKSVPYDSLTSTAPDQILLPINRTLWGTTFTLMAYSYTGNGAKVRLRDIRLFKYRAVNPTPVLK